MDGVLLRYRDNFIPYFKDENFDDSGFKQIIKDYEGKHDDLRRRAHLKKL